MRMFALKAFAIITLIIGAATYLVTTAISGTRFPDVLSAMCSRSFFRYIIPRTCYSISTPRIIRPDFSPLVNLQRRLVELDRLFTGFDVQRSLKDESNLLDVFYDAKDRSIIDGDELSKLHTCLSQESAALKMMSLSSWKSAAIPKILIANRIAVSMLRQSASSDLHPSGLLESALNAFLPLEAARRHRLQQQPVEDAWYRVANSLELALVHYMEDALRMSSSTRLIESGLTKVNNALLNEVRKAQTNRRLLSVELRTWFGGSETLLEDTESRRIFFTKFSKARIDMKKHVDTCNAVILWLWHIRSDIQRIRTLVESGVDSAVPLSDGGLTNEAFISDLESAITLLETYR